MPTSNRPLVLLLVASGLLVTSGSVSAASPPNVILFATDDLCDWVGPMGHTQAVTPNLDRLARSGVTFTNAQSPGTFCAPSRTAIFTGQYASTTGCYTTQVYFHEKPELLPLQASFQQAGYATYGAGKLFHHPAGYIDQRGWNEFYLRTEKQRQEGWPLDSWGDGTPIPQPYPNSRYNQGRVPANRFFLEWGPVPDELEEEMADTIRTNWACEVLGREHEKPFFLAVGLYAPHFPNYAPQKYFDLYDTSKIKAPPYKDNDLDDLPPKIRRQKIARRKQHHERLVEIGAVEDAIHGYLASVTYADAMLGRVLDALEVSPHADNTLIVFWSDHGYHHGEKGDWGKHTLWERTSNVPFIWAGPGVAKNQSVDATVSLIDIYPTFAERCNLPTKNDLEGVSQAAVLENPSTAQDRDVFLPYLTPGAYAIINQDWRYIRYDDGTEELYDTQHDPNEWRNLAGREDRSEIKASMRAQAPASFAPAGASRDRLQLVLDKQDYHWRTKLPRDQ
ncbi:Choline-sulfatase [Planctomycetes bacterium MalM25]|nr:Choline-sulfatase [Planctomycetes bacterium MalM25]